jgi:hypothetical protein
MEKFFAMICYCIPDFFEAIFFEKFLKNLKKAPFFRKILIFIYPDIYNSKNTLIATLQLRYFNRTGTSQSPIAPLP